MIKTVRIVEDGESQRLINVPAKRLTTGDTEGVYQPASVIVKEITAFDSALEQLLAHIRGTELLVEELQRHAEGNDQLEQLAMLRSALSTAESLSKSMVAH